MNIKNRTCYDTYNSVTNNITGYVFVIIISILATLSLKLNIISIIILFLWLVISGFITYRNIKKGKISKVIDNDIKSLDIKNGTIRFNMVDKTTVNYLYKSIERINISIETGICTPGYSTTIQNATLEFLFDDGITKQINLFYYSRAIFLNRIKYILKELKNYNINISYHGSGNISDIKELLNHFRRFNKSKLLNKTDTKDCITLSLMFAICGPLMCMLTAIITMIEMSFTDYILLFIKTCIFFLFIAILIALPVIIDIMRYKLSTFLRK